MSVRLLFASGVYCLGGEMCTVTVTDAKGERHSMDVFAQSSYDAAHLYVTSAKGQEAARLPSRAPVPTVATVFEVVVDNKILKIHGAALQRWIAKQRSELRGPRGELFRRRPGLE